MQIEISHNPVQLPCTAKLKVNSARECEYAIKDLMSTRRDRGMRLRHTYDIASNIIELGARNTEPLRVALRYLADRGLLRNAKRIK